jgi:hypothetical protein
LLSDAPVCVALLERQRQDVYVFSASVPIPYVTVNLRTSANFEQVVIAQSTVNPDGSYVVPATIDIDGLSLTPVKHGLLPTMKRNFELLHFGYVMTQWETFRRHVSTQQVLCHKDTSLPRQFIFYPRFTTIDTGDVQMLTIGCINQLCGETPTGLRMGIPAPKTYFTGLSVTPTGTQRKAAINSKLQSSREPRELEDMLEAQPQRFAMLGLLLRSCVGYFFFSGHLSNWWLTRK